MNQFDFVVVGGGSAGYSAASTAARLGRKVLVIEGGDEVGGLCILRGCMPSKTILESAHRAHAIRHAKATNLWLQVRADVDGVRLIARDDGEAPPRTTSSGTGLRGMRERLECLGGRLAIRAGGGAGFTIEAWLPSQGARPT